MKDLISAISKKEILHNMRYSYFTPNEETEALTDLMDKAIWFFELIATTEVELIKQRLRLIIKKKMKRKC